MPKLVEVLCALIQSVDESLLVHQLAIICVGMLCLKEKDKDSLVPVVESLMIHLSSPDVSVKMTSLVVFADLWFFLVLF